MKEQNNRSEFTIGLGLGERRHRFCVLDEAGNVMDTQEHRRFQRTVTLRETKSRHAVKCDG
jgi:hypothetical protein